MNQLERVARAICLANGSDPDEQTTETRGPFWELYKPDAQSAIDAMSDGIVAADRVAREDCARICTELAVKDVEQYDAYDCALAIRRSIK